MNMADAAREAFITGVGIVSCLGEGPDAHWQALGQGEPQADSAAFPPYLIHKLAPLDYDKQIPKKGDQRQMEAWQRIRHLCGRSRRFRLREASKGRR